MLRYDPSRILLYERRGVELFVREPLLGPFNILESDVVWTFGMTRCVAQVKKSTRVIVALHGSAERGIDPWTYRPCHGERGILPNVGLPESELARLKLHSPYVVRR